MFFYTKNEIEAMKQSELWLQVVDITYGNYQGGIARDLSKYRFNGKAYQQYALACAGGSILENFKLELRKVCYNKLQKK
ncbi:hypothetical protein [Propionispira raffinosivorans]|uniref:hypothetical protein n=1 Tax=Propionispira raffinosivorans TaxID=86959 RepID=UPI001B7FB1BE|nr:hypothetical protein [Propionispira raffinosivorans]